MVFFVEIAFLLISMILNTEHRAREPFMDSNPASKGHPLSSLYKDPIQLQCDILKEMGLSYEEEDSKVKGLLLDMENKDDLIAAEKGIKSQQL